MAQPKIPLGDELLTPYHRDGYVIIDRCIAPDMLNELRAECATAIEARDAEMTGLGVDRLGLCHRGRRYFLHRYEQSETIRRFVASEAMVELAASLLGGDVYLFNEQLVWKAAEQGLGFSWHQDSGYIPYPHPSYLTFWIPLDDVDEANGTVSILPFTTVCTRTPVEHRRDAASGDLVGYDGDEAGVLVEVPAGTLAAFSSTTLHRTSPNTTPRPRRAYVVQYSSEPILDESGTAPRHHAELLS